jgi:large subunit ribosomal protein L13
MAKPLEVERKWYIVDATDIPLGRLASRVAAILRGKNKVNFTPNVDCGDHVIVLNSDKVILTGNKLANKFYRHHTGFVGGLKEVSYRDIIEKRSDFAVMTAVKGMLPKNSLGKKMLKKLRVYKDDKHNHQAQKPVAINLNEVIYHG